MKIKVIEKDWMFNPEEPHVAWIKTFELEYCCIKLENTLAFEKIEKLVKLDLEENVFRPFFIEVFFKVLSSYQTESETKKILEIANRELINNHKLIGLLTRKIRGSESLETRIDFKGSLPDLSISNQGIEITNTDNCIFVVCETRLVYIDNHPSRRVISNILVIQLQELEKNNIEKISVIQMADINKPNQ